MLHPLEPDIALVIAERRRNRVFAIGALRAVKASPRQQARQLRDGYAEYLLGEDVIDPRL